MKARALMAVALALSVAWASSALAQQKKERKGRSKGQTIAGTLNEAAVAGDTVTWKITAEDGMDKELPMSTNIVVLYTEKGGQTRLTLIRVAGKKAPEAKGGRQVAQGTLSAVAADGNKFTVTVDVDGEKKAFSLTKRVRIMAREKAGATEALGIAPGGGRKKKGDGAEPR